MCGPCSDAAIHVRLARKSKIVRCEEVETHSAVPTMFKQSTMYEGSIFPLNGMSLLGRVRVPDLHFDFLPGASSESVRDFQTDSEVHLTERDTSGPPTPLAIDSGIQRCVRCNIEAEGYGDHDDRLERKIRSR